MKERVDLHVAQHVAGKYIDLLKPFCDRIQVAGSVRRKRPRVGDIEIVCIPKTVVTKDGMFHEQTVRAPGFAKALSDANVNLLKGDPRTGKYTQMMTTEGIQIDLFMPNKDNWGRIYMIRTGSSEFSQFMAGRWVKWGYKAIDGVLWEVDEFKNPLRIVTTPTEKSIFELLSLKVVPPHKRNQKGLPR